MTVGGVSPKKVKYKGFDEAANGFTSLIAKGKFCNGLPGEIVVTNPDGPERAVVLRPALFGSVGSATRDPCVLAGLATNSQSELSGALRGVNFRSSSIARLKRTVHPSMPADVCSPAKCTRPSGRCATGSSVVIWPGSK